MSLQDYKVISENNELALDSQEETVIIDGEAALDVLRHSARRIAITEMFRTKSSYTASELASITGTSPSSMSYHLRLLQRHHVVKAVLSAADSRERRWIAAGDELVIRSNDVNAVDELKSRRINTVADGHADAAEVLVYNRLYLTEDQLTQVRQEIHQVLVRAQELSSVAPAPESVAESASLARSILASISLVGMPLSPNVRLTDNI